MMPMSQIDMVIFKDDPSHLQVCGDFEPERGRPSSRPEVHVVVRQGDVVAKGHDVVKEDSSWTVVVAAEQLARFTDAEPAVACGVIIVEQEPGGLESLSWVQEVQIRRGDRAAENRPFVFPAREPVAAPEGGRLPEGRAVSSSLAILKGPDPERLAWRREVSIRPVELAEVEQLS
jgi:hypothetical protein